MMEKMWMLSRDNENIPIIAQQAGQKTFECGQFSY